MNVNKSAAEILGNPDYPAMCFGGFRELTRDSVPSVADLKEDLNILSAMGVKILRTYNTTGDEQVANLLQAIREKKNEDADFEMYVMLGAWMACDIVDDTAVHNQGNLKWIKSEIDEAIRLTNEYPDIVKIIAVGNEAMVHWQGYHVAPNVILRWVNLLQELKKEGKLPADIWITSSDNFASWGGGDPIYHKRNLEKLINAVDFIAMHTYPFHDTHYNPQFWLRPNIDSLSATEKSELAIQRSVDYAMAQYESVRNYVSGLGYENKPIHITETGWSSQTNDWYGSKGSRAADEYKQKLYYEGVVKSCEEQSMTCFYFEIFDESWKDDKNPKGSENHFGLINLKGQAKYALWDLVDKGVFEGITRGGNPITKTFNGEINELLKAVHPPRTLELSEN
ncbi:Exo-beta-1,3-glucanase, GH17 family [Ekhidna lutea]|uniref:Endo-1,3-beta-glucanase btgC n=2 Tax=Ekhidna lutea TaxID=447679 RepID=A0A239LVZ0_EKHLU|nr:Exo-beta-1,3-glucanase, GH17 family [Ekhidna lutea]